MKYLHISLCAAALAVTAGAAMAADETSNVVAGPYVSVGGIYNFIEKDAVNVSGTTHNAKFKNGWGVLGAGGYEWETGVRTELELSHRENKGKYIDTSATPLGGKRNDTALMANILFDLNNSTKLTPYFGAGIGVDWVKWSNVGTGTPPVFSGSKGSVAWQAILGLAYNIDTNLKLIGEFRYMKSVDHNYTGTAGATAKGWDDGDGQFLLGLRYSFGTPAKKEVAAAPPPAPAPAPVRAPAPPVPQKFLVFFDFDKSNLRSDAQKIVSESVTYAKTNGKATIVVTGHADTSGSDAYNMALSERRAQTVEKELERLGIPASEVSVHWKGESEPLVQTGDGVKEPQNRRVEIILE